MSCPTAARGIRRLQAWRAPAQRASESLRRSVRLSSPLLKFPRLRRCASTT